MALAPSQHDDDPRHLPQNRDPKNTNLKTDLKDNERSLVYSSIMTIRRKGQKGKEGKTTRKAKKKG